MLLDSSHLRHAPIMSVSVDFNENCVMMYGPKYGTLVKWNATLAHQWNIVGFPRAQLILRAQSTLMGILRRVVKTLLETSPFDSTSVKFQSLVQTDFNAEQQTTFFSPYRNQPFSKAPTLQTSLCLEQAQSRLAAAEDEVWLLQMDPP